MQVTEKISLKQDENSPLSNENEFKELDNEIEKVVRGEASYEEEQLDKNNADLNNTQNMFQEYNKIKTNSPINRSNCNTPVNGVEEQNTYFKNVGNNKQFNQNCFNASNNSEKCVNNSPMNFDKLFFTNNNNFNNNSNNLNLNNYENIITKNKKTQIKKLKIKNINLRKIKILIHLIIIIIV